MIKRCSLRACYLFVALTLVLKAGAQPVANVFEHAESLFKQYKLADSHAAYDSIATNAAADNSVRVKARLKLAEQDWKFYNDYPGAMKHLQAARLLNTGFNAINILQATIQMEHGDYGEAKKHLVESVGKGKSEQDRIDIALLFAKLICSQSFNGKIPGQRLDAVYLRNTQRGLNAILEKQPGNPDASEMLIGISLLLNDGNGIIKGWKSYYLVSDEQNINQALKQGFAELKSAANGWKGGPLSAKKMERLAIGFSHSKFFNYAGYVVNEIIAKLPDVFDQSIILKDIVGYNNYIDAVKVVNDKIYPAVARGKTKYEDEYDSLMNKAGKELWEWRGPIDNPQKFDPDTLYNNLNREYGTEGYTGTTVNYYGMLMGHIIHKELKQVSQYGYSTKFTYISVDRLISRDFTSWYGTTNVGGWGDSTTIIQVRKAYMTEPFEELNWMTDPAEHKRITALIAQKKQYDLEICKKDPYAEPKFLALYLKFNEASKIYKRLAASGLKGMQLNIGFIDQILRLTVASTVFAHEGRHAIDQLYFPAAFKTMTDDERELRAKFSEVVFSLNPKMAFTGSILGSDLDASTNHGKANLRFRKIIAGWMAAHYEEISGLDKNVPLLMQFDLLTDEQLIAICKSADPFAKAQGKQ